MRGINGAAVFYFAKYPFSYRRQKNNKATQLVKHSFKKKKGSFCLSLCLTGLIISDLQRETGRKTEWEPVKGGQVRSLHLQVKAVVVGEEGAGE